MDNNPERWEIGGVLQWTAFERGWVRAQVSKANSGQQKALSHRGDPGVAGSTP